MNIEEEDQPQHEDNDNDLIISDETTTIVEDEDENIIDGEDITDELNKYIIPYRHSYKSNTISFSYWSENINAFIPVTGNFEVVFQCYGQTLNLDRQKRMESFIESIEGSFFIPSSSEINPLFCNGTIKNVSFEMPIREITVPVILSFVYYKARAMFSEYADIFIFKFTPTYENNTVYVDVNLHESTNPYIDEEEWLDDLVMSVHADDEEIDEYDQEFIENLLPWWHRDDGSTRDYCYGNFSNQPAVHILMDIHEVPDNEFSKYPLFYDNEGNPVINGGDEETDRLDAEITQSTPDDRNTLIDDVGNMNEEDAIEAIERFKKVISERTSQDISSSDVDDDDIILGTGK